MLMIDGQIKDEFTLVNDLTYHLAQRYTRPDSSIMIRVDHSACLALGGNFEPCYMLTVHAVPPQMGPTTNKRNASLIQKFMESILSVRADRGIVTFVTIAEENLATNGQTMLGEIEQQSQSRRASVNDPNNLKSAIKDATRRSMTFPKSDDKLNGSYTKSNGLLATGSTNSPSITPPPPQLNNKTSSGEINGRPSTAHGGFDGLRMNGISTDMLVGDNARLPNGRPKSLGAKPASSASIQDALKSEPLPHLVSQSQSQRHSIQRQSLTKRPSTSATSTATAVQPTTKSNGALAPRPATSARTKSSASGPTAARPATSSMPFETRSKNTYLDSNVPLTKKGTPTTYYSTNDADDEDAPLAKTAAGKANTAKRRSTITATPQLPNRTSKERERAKTKGALKPPPVPDETRSVSSKLSKRKSFLRMFKRQSVPAWYEQ
jgi:hypothetical protein